MAYLSDSIYKIKADLYYKKNKHSNNSELKGNEISTPSIHTGLKEEYIRDKVFHTQGTYILSFLSKTMFTYYLDICHLRGIAG